MKGKAVQEIKVGDRAQFAKTISESDVYLYAGITGDFNPAHINAEYAKKTPIYANFTYVMQVHILPNSTN